VSEVRPFRRTLLSALVCNRSRRRAVGNPGGRIDAHNPRHVPDLLQRAHGGRGRLVVPGDLGNHARGGNFEYSTRPAGAAAADDPHLRPDGAFGAFANVRQMTKARSLDRALSVLVEPVGIEPTTSTMP